MGSESRGTRSENERDEKKRKGSTVVEVGGGRGVCSTGRLEKSARGEEKEKAKKKRRKEKKVGRGRVKK